MSQQEVKAEFIEGTERKQVQKKWPGDSEWKVGSLSLSFAWGLGFFIEDHGLCPFRRPGTGVTPWSQGILASRYLVPVVWNSL